MFDSTQDPEPEDAFLSALLQFASAWPAVRDETSRVTTADGIRWWIMGCLAEQRVAGGERLPAEAKPCDLPELAEERIREAIAALRRMGNAEIAGDPDTADRELSHFLRHMEAGLEVANS